MLKRLLQGSSANGLAVLTMILGMYLGPDEVDAVVAAGGALYTAYKLLQDNDRF